MVRVFYINHENTLVKVTLRSVAGIKHALRGHYQVIFRAWWAHKKGMICTSGHKWAIIRALYEHDYPPCVLLMLQVCPGNAHLWTSSDLLKIPSFFFTILSWCLHTALISEASQGIICASFNHFHTINALFMNCCCSDGALMAALHYFTFFFDFFFILRPITDYLFVFS